VYNAGSGGQPTTSGVGAHVFGLSDGSDIEHVTIDDSQDPIGALIEGTCCGFTWGHSAFNSRYTAGAIPLQIQNLSTTTGRSQGINLIADSFDHPGAGKPVINILDNYQHHTSVHIFGGYTETSNSDTTTALIASSGAAELLISGLVIHCNDASAAPLLTIDNTYNTLVIVHDVSMQGGGTACGSFASGTVPAIVNSYTGQTIYWDTAGHLGDYNSGSTSIDGNLHVAGTVTGGVGEVWQTYGNCGSFGTGNCGLYQFTTVAPMVLDRIDVQVSTAPVTCSVAAVYGLYDTTAAGTILGVTIANGSYTDYAVGPITVPVGHVIQWRTITNSSGCATNGGGPYITTQWHP
jgi:hypothetical protein